MRIPLADWSRCRVANWRYRRAQALCAQATNRIVCGHGYWELMTDSPKDNVRTLLDKLPGDCTLEDVQYHLYVIEKINRGIDRANEEGALPHDEIQKRFGKWTAS